MKDGILGSADAEVNLGHIHTRLCVYIGCMVPTCCEVCCVVPDTGVLCVVWYRTPACCVVCGTGHRRDVWCVVPDTGVLCGVWFQLGDLAHPIIGHHVVLQPVEDGGLLQVEDDTPTDGLLVAYRWPTGGLLVAYFGLLLGADLGIYCYRYYCYYHY